MKLSVSLRFTRSYILCRTSWASDQLVAKPLPVHKHRQTHTHKHQTSMPWVGFELTVPDSEREKTVHALDGSATVTGEERPICNLNLSSQLGLKWPVKQNSKNVTTLSVDIQYKVRTNRPSSLVPLIYGGTWQNFLIFLFETRQRNWRVVNGIPVNILITIYEGLQIWKEGP
jgi:hypothetical protein